MVFEVAACDVSLIMLREGERERERERERESIWLRKIAHVSRNKK
jgi:hypothetical protein